MNCMAEDAAEGMNAFWKSASPSGVTVEREMG